MLNAIMTMIGYYVIILASAMVMIVIGIRIFKMLTASKQQEVHETTSVSDKASSEVEKELAAAAIAAVSVLLTSERTTASTWQLVERSPDSSWKLSSRSRRVSPAGG